MKKAAILCLVLALLCPCLSALAAKDPEYTISKKTGTVLQNVPDRHIAVQTAEEPRAAIPGESPMTGQLWEGSYLPVLVQIGNNTDTVKVSGNAVKSAGIGKRSPWGLQYADILYEEMLSPGGYTRITALFSDCFASGEPAGGVGPVRSCRIGPMLLREQWQGVLVYGGGMAGSYPMTDERMAWLYTESNALDWGLLVNFRAPGVFPEIGRAVKAVKSPDNFSVDLLKVRNGVSDAYTAQPRPFLFQNGGVYGGGYETATTVHLDWGDPDGISHFVYSEETGTYARYCGVGTNPKKWALYTAFPAAEDREEANRISFAFANVIVQRTEYAYEGGKNQTAVAQIVGSGNADLFIGGKYIAGYWVHETMDAPTVYYDDQGKEILLSRGKTYIAQFPAEARLTFTDGE